MPDRIPYQILTILAIVVLVGIFYNISNPRGIPFIGEERNVDFSQSDSLMNLLKIQDSIQRIADSLSQISDKRADSLKALEQKKILDSLALVRKQDSIKKVNDSLKAIDDKMKDSVKSEEKKEFIKPVDIRIDFAKALFDKGYTFIDARDVSDFSSGRIKGALNIPYKEIDKNKSRLESMAKDKVYVVYCSASCDVSIDMAYYMAKMGFRKVYIFHGGWDEWRDAGYPSE
ncbi:MAG: rhodanese-like domain-containing protein [Ignavibacteria bacterium]|nr:rhodanese-like domain-containing protein [Ignavibacteria bacterium]